MHDTSDQRQVFTILSLVQPSPDGTPVDRDEVKPPGFAGLSECPVEDRCLAWLILLGVFPDDPIEWSEKRASYVTSYKNFVTESGVAEWHLHYVPPNESRKFIHAPNDRLMWAIHLDITRTGRFLYFLPPGDPPVDAPDAMDGIYSVHMRRVERILDVFALCNPSLSYMQGFNELVLPLYFVNVAAIHYLDDDPDEVEALTFECFQRLVMGSEVRSFYTTTAQTSILADKMAEFLTLMKIHMQDVTDILAKLEIEPLHFCVPWFEYPFRPGTSAANNSDHMGLAFCTL